MGSVSQLLHWLIALLILALGVVGLTMGELPKTQVLLGLHRAQVDRHHRAGAGAVPSRLAPVCRCAEAGAGRASWQERIASATHVLLYVLMFAIPLSGWLYDSASGLRPFRWFGLVDVPKLSGPDPQVVAVSHALHEYGFWLLIAVVLAHRRCLLPTCSSAMQRCPACCRAAGSPPLRRTDR